MLILTLDTENKIRMFLANSVVEYNHVVGRVICHDKIERKVHVLVRQSEYTWVLKKWDDLHCKLSQSLLWHMESPFATGYNRSHSTPRLDAMEVEDTVHVLYLNR